MKQDVTWLKLFDFYNGLEIHQKRREINKQSGSLFTVNDANDFTVIRNKLIHFVSDEKILMQHCQKCVFSNLGPKVKSYQQMGKLDNGGDLKENFTIDLSEVDLFKSKIEPHGNICQAIKDQLARNKIILE